MGELTVIQRLATRNVVDLPVRPESDYLFENLPRLITEVQVAREQRAYHHNGFTAAAIGVFNTIDGIREVTGVSWRPLPGKHTPRRCAEQHICEQCGGIPVGPCTELLIGAKRRPSHDPFDYLVGGRGLCEPCTCMTLSTGRFGSWTRVTMFEPATRPGKMPENLVRMGYDEYLSITGYHPLEWDLRRLGIIR